MSEALKLTVDTGAVEVAVEDKGGVIGTFMFNPTDMDIVKRYDEIVKKLEDLTADEKFEDLLEISDQLKEYMDYLLGYNVSDALFAKCNPLSLTTNGDLYFEVVLDGIVGLIEKTMETRVKKKQARIKRATSKYHK